MESRAHVGFADAEDFRNFVVRSFIEPQGDEGFVDGGEYRNGNIIFRGEYVPEWLNLLKENLTTR